MNQIIQLSPVSSKKAFFIFIFLCFLVAYSKAAISAEPLNVNTATVEQLVSVMNGVGIKKAEAIIEYRNQTGGFSVLDDLIFVKGIGPALLEKNRDMLSIGDGVEFETESVEYEPL